MNRKLLSVVCLVIFLSMVCVSGTLYARTIGKVIALEGNAEVCHDGSTQWQSLSVKDILSGLDTIRTGKKSKLKIFLLDDSTIIVGAQSVMKLEKLVMRPSENYRDTRVRLSIGKARFEVRKMFSPKSNWKVHTPTAIAGVKGTDFMVFVFSPELTEILVSAGFVDVRNILLDILGEVRLRRNFVTEVRINHPPIKPKRIKTKQMREMLRTFGVKGEKSSEEDLKSAVNNVLKSGFMLNAGETGVDNSPRFILEQPKGEAFPRLPGPPEPPVD